LAGIIFWLCVVLIFYTYLGYPLVLTGLASLRPAQLFEPTDDLPKITLMIAAYNEETVIETKLNNSLALNYPQDKLQIIVAADGSDDSTVEIVRSFLDRGVELSYSPQRKGKMAAIRHAMKQAQGDIVVFSDANNMYAVDALENLLTPFCVAITGAATGAKKIVSSADSLNASEGLYWKYELDVRSKISIKHKIWYPHQHDDKKRNR
jgi:poly-beta-1,6-N-acetyl-D-glucosamine synthase